MISVQMNMIYIYHQRRNNQNKMTIHLVNANMIILITTKHHHTNVKRKERVENVEKKDIMHLNAEQNRIKEILNLVLNYIVTDVKEIITVPENVEQLDMAMVLQLMMRNQIAFVMTIAQDVEMIEEIDIIQKEAEIQIDPDQEIGISPEKDPNLEMMIDQEIELDLEMILETDQEADGVIKIKDVKSTIPRPKNHIIEP